MGDPGSARTILVVEDNPGDARLVEIFLIEDPAQVFSVIKTETLAAAISALASQTIDAILLDLSLPDSFGLDTLARLREANPSVPVVVLTGTDNQELAFRALRQGAQDYLVKGQGDGHLVRRSVGYAIERFQVELALRNSEARFRAVFESAGIGVVTRSAEGRFIQANPAFCAMLGYSEDELRTLSISDIAHPDEAETVALKLAEMADGTCDGYTAVRRYIGREGKLVWAKVTVTAVRLPSGALDFGVAVMEDITERKRLEDNMRLAATVFESSGEGLFVTDDKGRIVHVNPAFTEITGYAADEVLGHTPKILSSGRHGPEFYVLMRESLEATGNWQGEIWDRRKDGEMFAGWQNITAVLDAEGRLVNYVAVLSDITSRKQVEERLSYAANHDPLTRLPNRTLFMERLGRAIARAQRSRDLVALMFIDLDYFKQVNDSLGHLAGDLLLQQVAERLSTCVRQGDTVARLGGDEFTIILEDVDQPRDVAIVAHKVLHRLVEPFDLNGTTANISSSIGVALYPLDSQDTQELIHFADSSMYQAKTSGRNRCQFHSEQINTQAFERLALEESLRFAVERGEIELVYQPVFDLGTGQVAAVEALARWRHSQIGTLTPRQFLPLAEETGLILDIGRWGLDEACKQVAQWRNGPSPSLELRINFSGRQLRDDGLMSDIATALEATGLPPTALVAEIGETHAGDQPQAPTGLYERFAALRLGLSIQEFGSGYSSLSNMRKFAAGSVKVAQSFVRGAPTSADDSEIVTAIVALAKGLHMSVVAPGVETSAQLDFVMAAGCTHVQGFLLGRPMTAAEFGDFLSRRQVPDSLAERLPR
jgi:diguanylate cyclase (GGDEF)-like protein/PAS domain S-box-containing protein